MATPHALDASRPAAARSVEKPIDALTTLARRMGIAEGYEDARGGWKVTSPDTKRALLAAMGLPVSGEAEALDRLGALEERERRRLLPVLCVVDGTDLLLPLGPAAARGHLTIELEGGGVLERSGRGSRVPLPRDLPHGRHRLRLEVDGRSESCPLIRCPARCHLPRAIEQGGRVFGLAAQLPGLRTERSWGAGDHADLLELARFAGRCGADVIGLNPLHALFLDRPEHASPYSPSSRLALDVLAIAPERAAAMLGLDLPDAPSGEKLASLRAERLVDRVRVQAAKLPPLRALHAAVRARDGGPGPRELSFRARVGRGVERHSLWEALVTVMLERGQGADWRHWPAEYRDPEGPSVSRFAREQVERVDFHLFLQWLADAQLGDAAEAAREAGLAIGLYRDLAVGPDPSGSDAWAGQGILALGAQVGAPPDLLNPAGQGWGLPPLVGEASRADGHCTFAELVRANMRHAGALRIDHVMALRRAWWVPQGAGPADGAYVAAPFEELAAVLALESVRAGCMIVGEDLGTVPDGFREQMAERRILGYRVMTFERAEAPATGFKGPEAYEPLTLATFGSHDLATLRGWWEGHDLELKEKAGLYPGPGEALHQQTMRADDRAALLAAIRAARIALPDDLDAGSPWSEALPGAVHAFLAASRAGIAMVQLDDLAGNLDQVNLPGTVDAYPNWRRKLDQDLVQLERSQCSLAILQTMRAGRGSERPSSSARPSERL